jgi:hypothetical protein
MNDAPVPEEIKNEISELMALARQADASEEPPRAGWWIRCGNHDRFVTIGKGGGKKVSWQRSSIMMLL